MSVGDDAIEERDVEDRDAVSWVEEGVLWQKLRAAWSMRA
jgi:hypothetical protein